MKKLTVTSLKFIGFFLGWVFFACIIPLPDVKEPAIWRLWAEITPLFSIVVITFLFWLIEKRKVKLHLGDNLLKGIVVGLTAGIVWLGAAVVIMLFLDILAFDGRNQVSIFPIWMLAAFLNVAMQELLVRGYLYQMLKQTYASAVAAIVTSALFTLCHGGAFEAGIIPVLNVLTMSILMTVVLEYTGSLIAPTVMHFLWNSVGALVLGADSLAEDYPHLLNARFSGNGLLSGGACKMEGSIIVTAVNLVLILTFSFLKKKESGRIRA